MRRFLLNVAGLLLAAVFALPARAQPANNPFPANTIEARTAIRASLQAIGFSPLAALENRAALKRLAAELGKRYSTQPTVEEIKRLLLLLEPGAATQLDLTDPDRAPLKGTAFARQNLRGPNPDLQRVLDQTWPPDLTHGEKVALQSYSGSSAGIINQDLRLRGAVAPLYAQVHDRLQSAFRKARPFNPPITVSRGVRINGKPQLDDFVATVTAAHKKGTPYVLRGYGSTTVGDRVHPSFMGNVHMHFKATHGLDVYPISLFPQEREFLLNHNSSYRVTGIRTESGRWVIDLEQVAPAGK